LTGLGAASGLLIEIHLNGIHFIAATTLFVGLFAFRQRWEWQRWFAFGAGLVVAGLIWLTFHVWVAPPVSVTGQVGQNPATLGQLLFGQLLSVLQLSDFIIQNYLWGSGPGLFTGLLALIGSGVALWQRNQSDKFLIGFTFLSLLAFGIFRAHKPAYYTIVWIPLLIVLSARGLEKLVESLPLLPRVFSPSHRFLLVSIAVLSIYLAGCIYLLVKFSEHSFDRITSQLQSMVEPGAVVFGDPRAWFALPERTIIDSLELAKTRGVLGRDLTEGEVYELLATTYRPDYLFVGSNLTCFASPTLEARLLSQVAAKHCQLVAIIAEPWYEPNKLYRCNFIGSAR
jgi:hypothetical protein